MKVNVIFYKEEDSVLAVFPQIYEVGTKELSCYSRIGQHSTCTKEYLNGLKRAHYSEYYSLLRELISIGYNLNVINYEDHERECHRPPTPFELKQGYGATHYRTFKFSQIGHNKQGELKKWFYADDGLRYSTR